MSYTGFRQKVRYWLTYILGTTDVMTISQGETIFRIELCWVNRKSSNEI